MGGAFPRRRTSSTASGGTFHQADVRPSLCIVNYNGAAFLRPTLEAAVTRRDRFHEILLVDNGSDDESLVIAGEFAGVRVIALDENRGASAVRNAALRHAGSDLVLLLDSDVRLAPECADTLVAALTARNAAIAMPRVLYESAPGTVQYAGADWHFIGLQIIEPRDLPDAELSNRIRGIGSVITACCLVDRTKVGSAPFDEDFFIYLEDHDFGVRARMHGYEVLSVPAARCFHNEGTPGLSIRALGTYSSRRVFCLIRNRWQFIAKNYAGRTLLVLAPLFAFYEAAQFGMVLRKGWFGEWVRALGWMGRHAPRVLARRRELQSARVATDAELMRGGEIPFREELTAGSIERKAQATLNGVVTAYWRFAGRLI